MRTAAHNAKKGSGHPNGRAGLAILPMRGRPSRLSLGLATVRPLLSALLAAVLLQGCSPDLRWLAGREAFAVVALPGAFGGEMFALEAGHPGARQTSGRLSRGYRYQAGNADWYVYDVFWQVAEFCVVGDVVESVTFKADKGGFAGYDSLHVEPSLFVDDCKYNMVRHYVLESTIYDRLDGLSFLKLYEEIWGGAFDDVVGEEFRRSIMNAAALADEVNRIQWETDECDSNGYGYNGRYYYLYRHSEDLPQHYELQCRKDDVHITDEAAVGYYALLYSEFGQSVTVQTGQAVSYCPPFWLLNYVSRLDGEVSYPELGCDTLQVTVTTVAGATYTKAVYLSFDASGQLCASLQPPDADEYDATVSLPEVDKLAELGMESVMHGATQTWTFQVREGMPALTCFIEKHRALEPSEYHSLRVQLSIYDTESGELLQVLTTPGDSCQVTMQAAYFLDVTFDGCLDILVPADMPAWGTNFYAFIWDSGSGSFVLHPHFDRYHNIVVDAENRQIRHHGNQSQFRSYVISTYQDGQFVTTNMLNSHPAYFDKEYADYPHSIRRVIEERDGVVVNDFTYHEDDDPLIAPYLESGSLWDYKDPRWQSPFHYELRRWH